MNARNEAGERLGIQIELLATIKGVFSGVESVV